MYLYTARIFISITFALAWINSLLTINYYCLFKKQIVLSVYLSFIGRGAQNGLLPEHDEASLRLGSTPQLNNTTPEPLNYRLNLPW